ncbi:MAG: DUF5320 domain-containing protein [Eubacteriales bacterium]
MPGMNGTGPMGAGMQTGRGLGYCGKTEADSFSMGRGMGSGRNCRRGRGMGRLFSAVELTDEQKKEMLNQRKISLEKDLSILDEQLNNL